MYVIYRRKDQYIFVWMAVFDKAYASLNILYHLCRRSVRWTVTGLFQLHHRKPLHYRSHRILESLVKMDTTLQ